MSSASKTRVYHRLQLAAHRAQKSADRALMAAADITTAQSAVLLLTSAKDGGVTQREVAAQLGVNESGMTAMVRRLLDMGLLERIRDETDARAWRLQPSDEGRAALKRMEQPFRRINQTIEAALKPDEIAQLADYLTRIASAFEDG
ncbi:MarR family winged helix-turn-helix transcriptional regulator [Bradyrhizobium prioriisuperbiae]|uniref:MarR family winged helix-turn-helix transcriptional regulator n=1 Tax=Bradyrhizobium prioriisuperbiae TaxID=2854389 RepID=UPI0028E541DE|nr:MarR family winged helix-turn-helix transcriptional regulator [Bradyrhizobium prioritasuperba]